MNKTVLALTTALLLAGGAATTASAQTSHHHDRGTQRDHDHDGIPNRYDHNNNGTRRDADRDGIPNRYDHNNNNGTRRDADRDGIPNRYDRHDNRWDRSRFRYGQQNVYWALRAFSGPRYVQPYGYRYHRWQAGTYLPRGYYGDSYYVDYQPYGLPAPPYGYRWNRVGNDVYLVEITNGLISEVVYDLFH